MDFFLDESLRGDDDRSECDVVVCSIRAVHDVVFEINPWIPCRLPVLSAATAVARKVSERRVGACNLESASVCAPPLAALGE